MPESRKEEELSGVAFDGSDSSQKLAVPVDPGMYRLRLRSVV